MAAGTCWRLGVEAAEAAAVKDERGDIVVTVQVVHPQYDYVVISSRGKLFEAALEPGAGPLQQYCTAVCGAPVQAREPVAVRCAQLPTGLLVVGCQHANAQSGRLRQ